MMMNISELQKRVHETAVSKGWHESDELDASGHPTARQKLAWLALVTDELDEAEAEEAAVYLGSGGKPEGKLIEIVDAVIRLLDMAGACGTTIDIGPEDDAWDYDVPLQRSALVSVIRDGNRAELRGHMSALFLALWHEFEKARSDATEEEPLPAFEELIELKDAYNRTREWRHGGKLA
jgi:hypothetical protein